MPGNTHKKPHLGTSRNQNQDNRQAAEGHRKSEMVRVSLGMGKLTTRRAMRHLLFDEDLLLWWMQAGFSVAQQKEWLKPV